MFTTIWSSLSLIDHPLNKSFYFCMFQDIHPANRTLFEQLKELTHSNSLCTSREVSPRSFLPSPFYSGSGFMTFEDRFFITQSTQISLQSKFYRFLTFGDCCLRELSLYSRIQQNTDDNGSGFMTLEGCCFQRQILHNTI